MSRTKRVRRVRAVEAAEAAATAAQRRAAGVIVSPDEILAKRSPAGAWTRAQLAEWGVSWPPRQGWRRELEARWRAAQVKQKRAERERN